MPDIWLPDVVRLPDDQYRAGTLPRLAQRPSGLVIHSGESRDTVAEYITTHPLSYHVCWSHAHNALVQTVPLDYRAQHAGAAGNDWWGLALPGPWDQDPRSEHQRDEFERVLWIWRALTGGLPRYFCRHSDIDEHKRDPGPGFLDEWAAGVLMTHRVP